MTTLPYLLHEENTFDEEEEFERKHGASAWLCAAGNGACTIFLEVQWWTVAKKSKKFVHNYALS